MAPLKPGRGPFYRAEWLNTTMVGNLAILMWVFLEYPEHLPQGPMTWVLFAVMAAVLGLLINSEPTR